MIWKCNDGCHCNMRFSWATSMFCSNICWLLVLREPHPLFHVWLIITCTPHCFELHALTKFTKQTYSLHEAISTFASHVPMSASLRGATITDPSRYLFAIVNIHSYRYLQCIVNTNSEHVRITVLPIWITSGSDPDSWSEGNPGQKSWPIFNAAPDTLLPEIL